ncbi:helix-turn-helix domain-containing protein [Streptomyces sp. NPDC056169]|uniref:helix-turn-helix domain-containing protein n=1 Tax=Streptomyces sp. NPDC056169 TaxID=3345734 RepID=UPI0035DD3F91
MSGDDGSRTGGPAAAVRPLTLAELLQDGPLGDVEVYGAGDGGAEIVAVRIVDRLAALDRVQPRTAVVLTAGTAAAAWTVEMALRKAWEHAAACVVVSREAGHPDSVAELAGRLGVPLLVVAGDALDAAVRIASAVARPEAGRTALVAGAARRIAEAGTRPVRLLSALHAVLPSTSVALTAPSGELVAGRAAALDDPAGTALAVTVDVPGPGGERLVVLTARFRARAAGWEGTVREVLGLAVAPLTAWAAGERLAAERAERHAAGLLRELLDRSGGVARQDGPGAVDDGGEPAEHDPLIAGAVALGWPLRGPFVVYALRPGDAAEPAVGQLLTARWARAAVGSGPLVRYDGVWVSWEAVDASGDAHQDPVARAERRLRAASAEPGRLPPVAGAAAGPVAGLDGLGGALAEAVAAVAVVPLGGVVRADRVGPARLLAALPREALRGPAGLLLAPLLAVDRDGALLRTLAVLLDVGGAPSVAAARLGVHRNTVAARLERLRALGCDPDDPGLRLPLHLACRVLLDEPETGGSEGPRAGSGPRSEPASGPRSEPGAGTGQRDGADG